MSADTHTLTLPWVEAATSNFVQAGAMREAFSLALVAGENLIFSGPGGHGKSEFLNAAFDAISDLDLYVKSFGQGTSTDELYGGVDFSALNSQGNDGPAVLKYCPELSFLAKKAAIFEEAFDAPSRVLTSLKDTMTARALRNGHQYRKMDTSIIAVATNHSPTDIAELGPEVAALIERFPIQYEVRWGKYDEASFLDLLEADMTRQPAFERVIWEDVDALQKRARAATMSKTMNHMLAKIIVELLRDKIVISPRTAKKVQQIAKAAAVINGRDKVAPQDLIAMAFLPGAYAKRGRIVELIKKFEPDVVNEEKLEKFEQDFAPLREVLFDDDLASACSQEEFEAFTSLLRGIAKGIDSLSVSTELSVRRNNLRKEVETAMEKIERRKLEKFEQDFAPLREVLLEAELASVCAEGELEEFAGSLGAITKGIDSLVLVTNLSLRKSDLRKEVVMATDRVNVALDDLRLTEDAKSQRPMLKQLGRDIKAQINSVRYGRTVQDRNEALKMLQRTWDDLRALALHPDLEAERQGLYDTIELALKTQGIVLGAKSWALPA